ncbi:hypothetical protein FKW77_007170 [Venturia effusa]|uniref:Uncharacterized protein n=1 Tax=Venturia effusa TaxID=50376 RepID=A0A517LCJ7_9PEZI|nr:hypothetical protein FKW77_007170 [Venturia effusa]
MPTPDGHRPDNAPIRLVNQNEEEMLDVAANNDEQERFDHLHATCIAEVEDAREETEKVEHSEYDSALDSEMEYDVAEFKDELQEYLDNVQTAGSAWSEQTLTSFPNPGLQIHHLGIIPLPLSDHHAKAIIEFVSKISPPQSGMSADTVTRVAWELPCSAFELINPAWNAQLQQIVANAVVHLGVKSKVHVELHKLTLYEKDANQTISHCMSRSGKLGMFGSLEIYLPSQYEGGQVRLSHGKSTTLIDMASNSIQLDMKSLAWFTDVVAKMDAITSGHRLTLSYNMIQNPTMLDIPRAADFVKEEKHLQYLLRQWRKQLGDQEKFVYLLSQNYQVSKFSLAALQGKDALVAQRLLKAFSTQDFHMFFGQLTRTAYVRYGAELEATTSLKHVVDLEGLKLAETCPVDVEYEVIDEELFDDIIDGQDQEDYDDDLLTKTEKHASVAIFVPKENLPDFLMNLNPTLNLYKFVANMVTQHRDDPKLKVALAEIAKKGHFMSSSSMARLSLELHALSLFRRAIEISPSRKVTGIADEVLDELVKFLNKNVPQNLPDWRLWIQMVASNVKAVNNLPLLLEKLDTCLISAPYKLQFEAWRATMITDCLASVERFESKHCSFILLMIKTMSPDWTEKHFLPLLFGSATDGCHRTLLDTLFLERQVPQFQAVLEPICRHMLGRKGQAFVLKVVDLKPYAPTGPTHPGNPTVNHHLDKFFTRMENAMSLGVGNQVAVIVNASMDQICHGEDRPGHIPLSALHHNHIADAIRRFLDFGQKHPKVFRDSVALPFFTNLLEAPTNALLNKKPNEMTSWTRRAAGCRRPNCPACPLLTDFLISPSQRVKSMIMARDHREHVCKYFASPNLELRKEDIGSSCTLLIVKTTNGTDKQMAAWEKELADLEQAWAPLRCDYLKELLGNRYDELVMLSRLRDLSTATHDVGPRQNHDSSKVARSVSSPSTTPRRSLDSKSANALNARETTRVAGVKRAADAELAGGPRAKK